MGYFHLFFALAALKGVPKLARQGPRPPVPDRARIAAGVTQAIGTPPGFARVEAVKGYLNLYFSTAEYARRVVDESWPRARTSAAAHRRASG